MNIDIMSIDIINKIGFFSKTLSIIILFEVILYLFLSYIQEKYLSNFFLSFFNEEKEFTWKNFLFDIFFINTNLILGMYILVLSIINFFTGIVTSFSLVFTAISSILMLILYKIFVCYFYYKINGTEMEKVHWSSWFFFFDYAIYCAIPTAIFGLIILLITRLFTKKVLTVKNYLYLCIVGKISCTIYTQVILLLYKSI